MPHSKQVLLTTTPNIEGSRITNYLGPVSAQLVIGTGLLTDFFSSFTDLFVSTLLSRKAESDK
jgi:uncharacterized protein YbjQ (UPF0145 family)